MSDPPPVPGPADETHTQVTPDGARAVASHGAGTRLGGYRIERPLATGGTAVVYRAIDERLGRPVALKVLLETAYPQARERFLHEVRVVAALQHPNIVLLYGAGEDRGVAWAAMELLPGSLSQELRQQGRLSPEATSLAARDVCHGLDAAWRKGIVHRDIKPSNLMRDASGVVKVADFGLAKDLSLELHLTAPDVILGTPLYVSPEQASGRAAGVASDLYSLGATMYHLVAGRPPFESSSALDVIVRHAIEPVPPLPADVPAPLARLILSLLHKDPGKRPPDYSAVLGALDECLAAAGGPDETGLTPQGPMDHERGDAMSASLLAAARAAMQMGRPKRARALLEPVVKEKATGWVQAGFLLASALEDSGAIAEALGVLNAIVESDRSAEDRALALWNLGRMAEKESAAALGRAADLYARIGEISTTKFPKTLLEARIARLRRQIGDRAASGSHSS